MSYGFIITRHVNSERTNKYWNMCVKRIRYYYPMNIKIVIIDDNSNKEFLKADHKYPNVTVIQSEFKGRGEILPYYYLYKFHFFDNAVIIHDSVFFHGYIDFSKIKMKVIPFWHFDNAPKYENFRGSLRLIRRMKNIHYLTSVLSNKYTNQSLSLNKDHWMGCFGVQSYINFNFLSYIQKKYNIMSLVNVVTCRTDRCCLERIMGAIFYKENPLLHRYPSIMGDILKNWNWGYTFENYLNDVKKKQVKRLMVKVWTGR